MTGWVPRSQRLGKRTYGGPHEGVPPHMTHHLRTWLADVLDDYQGEGYFTQALCRRLEVEIESHCTSYGALMRWAEADPDQFLDAVEGALLKASPEEVRDLRDIFHQCGSAYTVDDDGHHIIDVVLPETTQSREKAVSVADAASDELHEAWVAAFGRSPDPSDAWDHAIKAVESVICPVVEPKRAKPTLGTSISALAADEGRHWKCLFPGIDKDQDVRPLVQTLRLIWPNPDRHGPVKRKPTLPEARAVVVQATAIVQWHREGPVVWR